MSEDVIKVLPDLSKGQVWKSSKTWWKILYVGTGQVHVEGPRGSVRGSTDGGKTFSELFTTMTRCGFIARIRKLNAQLEMSDISDQSERP